MQNQLLPLLAAVALLALPAHSQSHPECPQHPRNLEQMRGCYRPLLVFAPSAADPRLTAQRDALDHAADDMMDRNVLLVPITTPTTSVQAPLDAPYDVLSSAEIAALRRRFGVTAGSFKVLLLGEDGGVKLESEKPVAVDRLNSLIDTMPTRKREMQQPHTN